MTDRPTLRLPVGNRHVVVMPHAIERYMQRASRHEDLHTVREELKRLVLEHGRIGDTPKWRRIKEILSEQMGTEIPHGQIYLLLGDDIAFPLDEGETGLLAVTCITRAGISDMTRERRSARRRRAAVARREERNYRAWRGDSMQRWQ